MEVEDDAFGKGIRRRDGIRSGSLLSTMVVEVLRQDRGTLWLMKFKEAVEEGGPD